MKILFSTKAKDWRYGYVADKKRLIFGFHDRFYNINGEEVEKEESFYKTVKQDDMKWDEYLRKYEGKTESLKPESTIKPEYEIDDVFGNYGFKNKNGEFVIEPQYAFAHEFTNGLAAVNLNRTWYKTKDGKRYYENHWGYIDTNGKTVIGFNYDFATPFNKYGVAVVSNMYEDYRLIDMQGNEIPGTRLPYLQYYYDYSDRYLEFSQDNSVDNDEDKIGLYDTKERKVLFKPKYSDIDVYDDCFRVSVDKEGRQHQYFINEKEEIISPWLYSQGFAWVSRWDVNNVAAVGIKQIYESDNINGKIGKRNVFGLYSSKGKMILPQEYDHIRKVLDDIWFCYKDDCVTVVQTEPVD